MQRNFAQLNPEVIAAFLENQQAKGGSASSLDAYRRCLSKFYDSLPEDKQIHADTGINWKSQMEREGISPRSINTRLSVFNSLCDYVGHREFQTHDFLERPEIVRPELTRNEYLRLFQAAKILEKERSYLLVKVLGGAGLRIQELPQLTVDAVRAGTVELSYHNGHCRRVAHLPCGLQRELLDYIRREGIKDGPVFRTGNGRALSRTFVCRLLRDLCQTAQVEAEKSNPRCLWNMYLATRDAIFSSISVLADQAYDRMLETEDLSAAWNR